MLKKSFIPLSVVILLASCSGVGGTSSASSSGDASNGSDSSSSSGSSSDVVLPDLLETFQGFITAENYSIYLEDYGGNFINVFLPDAFYFKFDDSTSFSGYLTDEGGVYPFTVSSSGKVTFDYHFYDSYSDSIITDIYSAMYSFRDCSFSSDDYEKQSDGSYLIKDLTSTEAQILFMVCGFEVESSYSGMSLSDLTSMSLLWDSDNNPAIALAFDEESGRGTTIASVIDIGTSTLHSSVQNALDEGQTSKKRIAEGDAFYTELATLKNLRNFTLEITSNYPEGSGFSNYTTTSKYTKDSYYSVSSRESESDLGFTLVNGVVHNLAYDEVSSTYFVGDAYTSSSGDTYSSILDLVYSFADTSWNPKSFEARVLDGRYFIEDSAYNTVLTNLVNDTYFAFMVEGYYLDKEEDDYVFTLQLYETGTVTMRVTDIGTTTII